MDLCPHSSLLSLTTFRTAGCPVNFASRIALRSSTLPIIFPSVGLEGLEPPTVDVENPCAYPLRHRPWLMCLRQDSNLRHLP